MSNYKNELNFIEKHIKKTEMAISNAEKKPNVSIVEVTNLNDKLTILNNIKGLIVERIKEVEYKL